MARGYNKSSVVGGPIDPTVLNQLSARENLYKKRSGRTDKELLYLNGKTGWVKLSSSVNTLDSNKEENKDESIGDSTLAKNNVLFGGTFKEGSTKPKSGIHGLDPSVKREDAAYQKFDTIGFRPMPGITSFNITSKNRFGTLRVADIEFKVWSVEQLSQFESLYLRPGFTVILEWGHTAYLKNNEKVNFEPPRTITNFFDGEQDKNKLQDKIRDLKKKSDNNYDAIFGYIKNFSWSYRSDGGYDCSISIVSAGELIESVKISLSTDDTGTISNTAIIETEENYSNKSPLHLFIETIKSVPAGINITTPPGPPFRTPNTINEEVTDKLKVNCKELFNKYKELLKFSKEHVFKVLVYDLKNSEDVNENEAESKDAALRYIQMRDFLALLNAAYLLEDQNRKKLFDFSLDYDKSLFFTFDHHIALDPGIAVLPKGDENTSLKYDISDNAFIEQACSTEDANGNQTTLTNQSLLNIFLNVDFILNKVDNILRLSEENRTVIALVESILDELTVTLGSINDLGLHYEEDLYRYFLVDRKLTPNKSDLVKSRINLTGLKATVSQVSLSSRLSPNIAKMIAISAQAAGTDVGEDAENMFQWNKGLIDRTIKERKIPNLSNNEQSVKIRKMAARLIKHVNNFNTNKSYNSADIAGLTNTHKELMTYLSIGYNKNSTKTGAPGIIPFDLEVTLDGIGSIKVGQAFTINPGILPKKYDNVVGFLITGVSHVVSSNKWNTTLKAQTIILAGDELAEGENYNDAIDEVTEEILEGGFTSDPDIPFKLINQITDNGIIVDLSTFGKEISKEYFLNNFVNQSASVKGAFGNWLDDLYANFGGYEILITSAVRSFASARTLAKKGSGTQVGRSIHSYGGAIDINIKTPGGQIIKKANSTAEWEATGIPQSAQSYGIYWAVGYVGADGVPDHVHFGLNTTFDTVETFKEVLGNIQPEDRSGGSILDEVEKRINATGGSAINFGNPEFLKVPGKNLLKRGEFAQINISPSVYSQYLKEIDDELGTDNAAKTYGFKPIPFRRS